MQERVAGCSGLTHEQTNCTNENRCFLRTAPKWVTKTGETDLGLWQKRFSRKMNCSKLHSCVCPGGLFRAKSEAAHG